MKTLPIRPSAARPDVLRYPHPVLLARKLRRGQIKSFTVDGARYVLYRDRRGQVLAAPDACPHRGAPLHLGKVNRGGELACAYHGWRVRPDGTVCSPTVPSKSCRMPMLRTWERHGFIWVANADVPDTALPDFIAPGHKLITGFTRTFTAPLPVVLDNFGEVEHAFSVHTFIGPAEDQLHTAEFSAEAFGDETLGAFACDNRTLPLGLHRMFGIRPGDRYHNDWVFRFRPLHGSYRNYWTGPEGQRRRVSFIVTSFLVPTTEGQVDVHVFLQIADAGGVLRLLAPIIELAAAAIVRFEIWADARIARFAPATADDGRTWQLTSWDKQIFMNRKRLETLYYGRPPLSVAAEAEASR